jgi:hypothetical protein
MLDYLRAWGKRSSWALHHDLHTEEQESAPKTRISLHVIPMKHEASHSTRGRSNIAIDIPKFSTELADLFSRASSRITESITESRVTSHEAAALTFLKHRRILGEDSQAGQVGHRRVTDRSLNSASSTYAETRR